MKMYKLHYHLWRDVLDTIRPIAQKLFTWSQRLSNLDYERTWWWLFQKRVVCPKLDIYVFFIDHKYIWHGTDQHNKL